MVKKVKRVKRHSAHTQKTDYSPVIYSAIAGAIAVGLLSAHFRKPKQRPLGYTITDAYNRIADKQFARRSSSNKNLLLLGALAGGTIGLLTILARNGGIKKNVDHLVEKIQDAKESAVEGIQSVDWGNIAEQVAESVVSRLQGDDENDEEEFEEEEEGPSDNIQKYVDWAILGFKVWQNLKK